MMTPPPRPKSSSTPEVSCLAQVKFDPNSRPCDNRFVAFIWSDSYQVSPSGTQCQLVMPPYCGNGRSACATVAVSGKPGYGGPKPREAAMAELTGAARSARSLALLRLRPWAASISGVTQLVQISPAAFHQAPRLPT